MKHVAQFARRFAADQGGNIFMIVALGMTAVVGSVGVAVDVARSQMVQAKLQSAVDSAGLVVGAKLNSTDTNALATKYVNVNFTQGTLGTKISSVTTSISSDNSLVTITAQASVPTTFMKMFGNKTVPISASAQITRAEKGMELVLVLDNTGSMNSPVNSSNSSVSKISAVKTAITGTGGLLDILYGTSANTVPNLWVGVVPFSQAVNIGTGYTSWMSTNSYDWGTPAKAWTGCVTARPAPYDMSDDVPSTSKFGDYYFATTGTVTSPAVNDPSTNKPDTGNCSDTATTANPNMNDWKCTLVKSVKSGTKTTNYNVITYDFDVTTTLGMAKGPNALCVAQKVLPMVAEKNTVAGTVNGMVAAGSTFINTGMAWGQRMLSPKWRGLWGGEMNTNQLPLNYNTQLMNKVVVLMTDGISQFLPGNYTSYGQLSDNQLGVTKSIYGSTQAGTYAAYTASAEKVMDDRTLAACNAMKANGVIIYTIGFGQNDNDDPNNTTDQLAVNGTLLKACATSPSYYFLAPTNADLQSAFHQIGDSLANLRISH